MKRRAKICMLPAESMHSNMKMQSEAGEEFMSGAKAIHALCKRAINISKKAQKKESCQPIHENANL